MYILDAFWSIIPGNEAKAYAALGALAAQVEKEEPDTWMYLIHTPNLDPGVNTFPMPGPQQVAFVEGFKDRDAYHQHANSPILKEFFAKNGAYFLNMYGPTVPFMMVQPLEMIDGFIRPGADVMTAWQVEARWVMKPGCREKVKEALKPYVNAVRTEEPTTLMYTVSVADMSEQSMARAAVTSRRARLQLILDQPAGILRSRQRTGVPGFPQGTRRPLRPGRPRLDDASVHDDVGLETLRRLLPQRSIHRVSVKDRFGTSPPGARVTSTYAEGDESDAKTIVGDADTGSGCVCMPRRLD